MPHFHVDVGDLIDRGEEEANGGVCEDPRSSACPDIPWPWFICMAPLLAALGSQGRGWQCCCDAAATCLHLCPVPCLQGQAKLLCNVSNLEESDAFEVPGRHRVWDLVLILSGAS